MKKSKKIIVLVFAILLLTGCGSDNYLKKGKQIITNPETGQSIQKNILCQPTDEKLLKIYKDNEKQLDYKLDELPTCKKFKINSGTYHSLWESIFVKPLAYIILKLGYLIKNFGVSVMIVGLLIRVILLPFTKKTMMQSENMKKANPELQRIEKKYANKSSQEDMMAKSQEMMMVYKKYGVNPVSSCLVTFIQLPLFFAFLQAINRVPANFEDKFLTMNLGMTPYKGITNGQYIYIVLILLIILTTYFSFKKSMSGNTPGAMGTEAEKQMNFMFKFMIIMISVASFSLPTAIALYWIVTNAFAIFQNAIIRKMLAKEDKKDIIIKPEKKKRK